MMFSSLSRNDAEIEPAFDADASNPQDQVLAVRDGAKFGDLESGGKNRRNSRPDPVVIQTPFGITLRGKNQLRAAIQTVALGALLVGCGVFQVYSSSIASLSLPVDGFGRRFLEEDIIIDENTTTTESDCDSERIAEVWWQLTLYILGILYMFLALAIVCDEFFVPALEELSGPHRMNLSMDVAGKSIKKETTTFCHVSGLRHTIHILVDPTRSEFDVMAKIHTLSNTLYYSYLLLARNGT
jgi:hypothetical protein